MNMKKYIEQTVELLFNKVTFLTVMINWGLIAVALYNRGYFNSPIHIFYETLLFNLVFIINLPAITFAGLIQPIPLTISNYSSNNILTLIAAITAQWWIVGFFIKQIFFNKKSEKVVDK